MFGPDNNPPEREHPLTTLGACGAIFIVGYFGTKWGWAVLKFGVGVSSHRRASLHSAHDSFWWLVIGGGIMAVGLAFMVGALWWTGKAIRAWRRGEMVE